MCKAFLNFVHAFFKKGGQGIPREFVPSKILLGACAHGLIHEVTKGCGNLKQRRSGTF